MKKNLEDSGEKAFLEESLMEIKLEKKEYINIFRIKEFKNFISVLNNIESREVFLDKFGLDLWNSEKVEEITEDEKEYDQIVFEKKTKINRIIYSELSGKEKLSIHLGEKENFIRVINNLNDKSHRLKFNQLWYLCKWIGVDVNKYLPKSINDDFSREKDYYDEIKIRNSKNPEYESAWRIYRELDLSLCKRICEESIYFSELQDRESEICIFYNSCEAKWRNVANRFLPILEELPISNENLGREERFSILCKEDIKIKKDVDAKLKADQEKEKRKYFELCMKSFDGNTLEMYINMAKDKDKNCLKMIRAYRFAKNEENEKYFNQLINLLNFGHRDRRNKEANKRVDRLCYNVHRKFKSGG